jgi:hypothetical protein
VSLTECWYDNPHSGQTSIRIEYFQEVIGWAGIYWVHPAENWGDRPGGYDLTGADRLTFWARSDTPNAQVKFFIGGIGYPVDYQGNPDLSGVVGGFGWVAEDEVTFYLDDIVYEFD